MKSKTNISKVHILDRIVNQKRIEIEERKALYPVALLEKSIYYQSPVVSLSHYIRREDKAGIIAEFKRKSPSVPSINPYASVEEVTIGYMQAGASALSILTDTPFFGGSPNDLTIARKFNFCPILRKDFIIDEYQIIEARSIGADAILLIAEILSAGELNHLAAFAHSLDMEVLMELHSSEMMDKFCDHVDVIGVNNRDLTTFTTDIQLSYRLVNDLPGDKVKISESGILTPEEVMELGKAGYDGFLIGELFMRENQPAVVCKQFIDKVHQLKQLL
ncbi:MAG TPA: indole-3-glycerol phosphate synthase TrpC [Saprospiraceae bacterium]|nr:indole-3-glycerol phosphate synthase TrpC [Saprospiraceae bacterium]